MTKTKRRILVILLFIILLVGLSLLLYPTFSDYWNSFHQSRAIASYEEAVENLSEEEYEQLQTAAQAYNQALLSYDNRWELTQEQYDEYMNTLDVSGTGIMGYIEIPTISVSIAIYHGTEETVLQTGVGHLEGTSLPIGGPSTHAALSGHRGLRSAKLFTDIDQLSEGDLFYIHVLGETHTYQIDQIHIVLPGELNDLAIETGNDYCTLITCTPYGVNTHRLLVRGHRIETENAEALISEDAHQVNPLLAAIGFGIVVLVIYLLIYHFLKGRYLKYF